MAQLGEYACHAFPPFLLKTPLPLPHSFQHDITHKPLLSQAGQQLPHWHSSCHPAVEVIENNKTQLLCRITPRSRPDGAHCEAPASQSSAGPVARATSCPQAVEVTPCPDMQTGAVICMRTCAMLITQMTCCHESTCAMLMLHVSCFDNSLTPCVLACMCALSANQANNIVQVWMHQL